MIISVAFRCFLAREVQSDAMQVGDLARERGDRKLLNVAPTGTGKTAVLLHRLVDEIRDEDLTKRGLKVKFVLADQNGHVEQLYNDIRALNPKTRRKKKMEVGKSRKRVELETIYIPNEMTEVSDLKNSHEKPSTRFELMVWGEGMGKKTSISDLYQLASGSFEKF